MEKCENCGNNREEYLNHYCKKCLDKKIDNESGEMEATKNEWIL